MTNGLPLKIAARPSVVEARDLNRIEESSADCVSRFRVQAAQASPELFITICNVRPHRESFYVSYMVMRVVKL